MHHNEPGKSTLTYRIGTHPTFLQQMLDCLYAQDRRPDTRRLAALPPHAGEDPALALLDAWATVADVLTFYQERIANEGYLRTATEPRSILELARAVSYEFSPGVAASTYLVFTVEEAPGGPEQVTVPKGTQVQSLPPPDQFPQTFETNEELIARAAWNVLRPQQRQAQSQSITNATQELYLKGVNTQLRPGDAILLVGDKSENMDWLFGMVQTVQTQAEEDYTCVTWHKEGGSDQQVALSKPQLYALRQRASLFGHNAPDGRLMSDEIKKAYKVEAQAVPPEWPNFHIQPLQIDLDTTYPAILAESWVVLMHSANATLCKAKSVSTVTRVDFMLSAKVTRIEADEGNFNAFGLRETVVFAQSEALTLAQVPLEEPIKGDTIVLDGVVPELPPGRALIVRSKKQNATTGEVVFVLGTCPKTEHTTITLRESLKGCYDRTTVEMYANVVDATHGEMVHDEVLGSGDAAQANQRFPLKKLPLTYVQPPTSTLEVRVNGVRWQEVPSLYYEDARSQSYMVRIEDDGSTAVIFGDGLRGARLPTGLENVTATYRSGLGPDGAVEAESLTLLTTRPLGIREVTNPLPATGAAARDTLEEARIKAPSTALTLERIVSLRDVEDFARAFPGIGKAQAVPLWDGTTSLVHLTIVGVHGEVIKASSGLANTLLNAIAARASTSAVRVDRYEQKFFKLKAQVRVDPAHRAETVMNRVKAALVDAFAFARRTFGQAVRRAEVLATIHSVSGVVAAHLIFLYCDNSKTLQSVLEAHTARWDGAKIQPAELLLLAPEDAINLTLWEER